MLQQTQVATVRDYFTRWMQRFPTLEALARADEDSVLQCWEGLGYYSRARRLLAGARAVLEEHGGQLPRDAAELQRLPGIGPYSAGAIASIAFDQPAPIVDGNVVRVLARAFGLRGDPNRAPLKREIWQLAERLIPAGRAGAFNQAMMELGATVCTPRSPNCAVCPLAQQCSARHQDLVERLPELPKRAKATEQRQVAALVARRGKVLLVKLPDDAPRWAGMWQLPTATLDSVQSARSAAAQRNARLRDVLQRSTGLEGSIGGRLLGLRYSVTRFRVTLEVFAVKASGRVPRSLQPTTSWQSLEDTRRFAMPAAHRRIVDSLLNAQSSSGGPTQK